MARGITQEQVNMAADKLLHAGERPTIDRVRLALGTGSPNTLTRLLDVWWAALGRRLETQERRLALPEAPDAVAQAAGALWTLALEHAAERAHAHFEDDRRQLAEAEAIASAGVAQAIASRDQAVEAAAAADIALSAALVRTSDLQRLQAQQAEQILELQRQRDDLARQRDDATQRAEANAAELHQALAGLADERRRRDDQARANEDRWLQEVDRARQETVAAQRQLGRLEHDSRAAATKSADQVDHLQRALRDVERRAATSEAKAEALEQEIARLYEQLARHAVLDHRLGEQPRKQSPSGVKRSTKRRP